MSDAGVKSEDDELAFPKRLGSDEPGVTCDMPIDVDDDDDDEDGPNGGERHDDSAPAQVKQEVEELTELPDTVLRSIGFDEASAIVIVDDDENNEAQISVVKEQSVLPLTVSDPFYKASRRSKDEYRAFRKRLREGHINDGYGLISTNASALDLSNISPQKTFMPTSSSTCGDATADHGARQAQELTNIKNEVLYWASVHEGDKRAGKEAAKKLCQEEEGAEDDNSDSEQDESDQENLFVGDKPRYRKKDQWPERGAREYNEDDVFDIGEGSSTGLYRHERGQTEEYEEQFRAEHDERKKRKRKKAETAGSKKSAKKGEGRKKRRREKEPETPTRQAIGNLMNTNVFRDAAANRNAPDLPDITDTRKVEALNKLLRSVPEGERKKAIVEKRELFEAGKKFSRGSVRVDGAGGWKVAGMVTSLKNYQLIGAGFMREREAGEKEEDKPFGGICADAMGLGKTVVMIANIINSRPKKPIPGEPRATLIVLPATLVTQWAEEIKRHINPNRKVQVLTYKAGNRLFSDSAPEILGNFDIVLTTYYEVQQSYPKTEIPLELQTSEEKNAWWKGYFERNKGDLHRVVWKRIVLDEAQQIKNFRSRTSLACRALQGKYRWALSGTPILNSPLELYPFFKFLGVPFTGSFRVFRENYYGKGIGGEEEPLERLSIMVSRFMIRRTHKDTMFGAPILRLPKASERIHWVKFNDLERGIYEIVHRRMVARVNSFARERTLERNYRNVLTMLLRLRQMTGNILMVEVVMKDLLEREDHEKIRELADMEARGDETRRAQLIDLRRLLAKPLTTELDPADDQAKDEGTPINDSNDAHPDSILADVPDEEIYIGRGHGLKFAFGKYLKDLREGKRWEELKDRTICVWCRAVPDTPYVTACYHIYCKECLQVTSHESALRDEKRSRCVECQIEYSWAHPCDAFELESIMSDAEGTEINSAAAPVERWRKKKNDKKKKKQQRNIENEITSSWIAKHGKVLPSAKTIAVKAQVLNWLEEDPNCKILVYTQFIAMIQILKKICEMEHWSFQEYSGQMSIASRDRALETFKQNNISILLASLKCGGLGLNLTQAKHVISIDPWWNSALEQQAFCRVFRIGQEHETSMTRFVVEGTIDEKLIEMQDQKQQEIDQVMGDSAPRRDNLSTHDLMRLFGTVQQDGDGRPFVIVEDKATLPRVNADSEDEGDEE